MEPPYSSLARAEHEQCTDCTDCTDCTTDNLELEVSQFLRVQFMGPQALVRELLVLGLVPWLVHVRGHTSERARVGA